MDTGIVFTRVDLEKPVSIKAEPTRVNDTRMATTLDKDGAKISTIEHLMSAFSGLGIDNYFCGCGCAGNSDYGRLRSVFCLHYSGAGIVEQNAPRKFVRVLKPVEVRLQDKWVRLSPYEGFKLDFTIAFNHPAIDETVQSVEVDFNVNSYQKDVSRARTFGFINDLEMLRSMGLAQGGSLDNAIVLDEYHVINVDGLRSKDEFAKHKLLDAMGDLYVLGHPLVAKYSAFKSGHDLNNKLLRKLLEDPSNWEFVTYGEETKQVPEAFTKGLAFQAV